MQKIGNLRKMEVDLKNNKAIYNLYLYNKTTKQEDSILMNDLVGKQINLNYTGNIHCVVTGKKIPKAYGEGMSWDAFQNSPMADQSIVKPELSTSHLGIERRDLEWEIKHHVTPHFVYLTFTSDYKVGVTRYTQIPTRWIDQGAVAGLKIAETPYRQAAGLIEIALKDFVKDKTNWRKMLSSQETDSTKIKALREELVKHIPEKLKAYILEDKEENVQFIEYPVLQYPTKITSLKLDKFPVLNKTLTGIKGQYLIFDDNTVINIRSHSGYEIEFNY